MIAAASARLPGLDMLRTIAITAVVIYHLQWFLPVGFKPIGDLGWMGVDLFFVLSGYLIGGQILNPFLRGAAPRFRDFYIRRAYRILPAYFTVLLLYLTIPAWREQPRLPAPWKFLTFTANLFMNLPHERAFSHAWSLCIEEHFYLLLPALVLWCMYKPSWRKTVLLVGSAVLFGAMLRSWELFHVIRNPAVPGNQVAALFMKRLYYPTYSRLDGLVTGVCIATVQLFRPHWWSTFRTHSKTVLVSGVAISGCAVWLFRGVYPSTDNAWGIIAGYPVLALGFGLIVVAAATGRGVLSIRVPCVQALATLAFSLYLTHKEVAHILQLRFPWLLDHIGWVSTTVYAMSCLAVASVLYLCVERPFIHLRDRLNVNATAHHASLPSQLDPAL